MAFLLSNPQEMQSFFQSAVAIDPFHEELGKLRPEDGPDYSQDVQGFQFLSTPGHGFLVVPKDHQFASVAKKICAGFGYIGKLAYYLEEDCQAPEFLNSIA